ncbi:MAG: 2-oxoacid:acceptor oxidoreductase family protein [Syntrophobacteraceae bacterium]|nr:2-oxoacid:acceptor oxidoreductase family protein [Desulfobacteraceae bacterium]
MIHQVLIAGFGGQGVLMAGQVLALAALVEGKQVTWMPSYGPEQRGGTACCVVTISDRPIGSPLPEKLSAALIFNRPSLIKYEPLLNDGSLVILNSSIVQAKDECRRHYAYHVPADALARTAGLAKAGNVVMLGSYVEASGIVSPAAVEEALAGYLGPAKQHLMEANRKALAAGQHFVHDLWVQSGTLPEEAIPA